MKILITGPRGFIASRLIERLADSAKADQYSITTLDRKNGNLIDLPAYFEREKFDAIVHLATMFLKNHEYSQITPLIDSNLTLTTQLLEAAARAGTPHFLTFSTYYEFPTPASLYAATKAAMGPLLDYYARTSNTQITELYLYDTYGPNDPRDKVVNFLIKSALAGTPTPLSPGEQQLKLLHVQDVCSAIEQALKLKQSDSEPKTVARYGLAPLEAPTLKEIAAMVETAVGKKLNAQWGARDYTPGVQMKPSIPHPALPGWKAQISLAQGLVEVAKNT
ncbi:MAG: NAD(P)-dependent oxidoreductase [Bdellovibrionales bacterium]|nr:NAD(P)-dependent oxidoreductase [Bdellovibrionales bacterium]